MEVGIATEFEQEDISTTFSKCQRYYQVGQMSATYNGVMAYLRTHSLLPVYMRANPTSAVFDNAGTSGKVSGDSTNNIAGAISATTQRVFVTTNNVVIGNNVFMQASHTLDAEL